MDRAGRLAPRAGPLAALTLGAGAVYVVALMLVAGRTSYDVWGAMIVGPLLFVITLPLLARQAAREGDGRLLWLLAIALAVKLLGALARLWVVFHVYEGTADAFVYHDAAVPIMEGFLSGDLDHGLPSLTGTDFIKFTTAVLYTIIGPTRIGGFLFYSWLGFLGLLMFYRAFLEGVPEGRPRSYARLIFFLPSLVFWSSSIGKEAWMMFALGVCALGTARLLSGKVWRGLAVSSMGIWLAALPRPHVAGVLGGAVAAAFLLARPRRELGTLGPLVKVAFSAVLIVAAVGFARNAEDFLKDSGVLTTGGLGEVGQEIGRRSELGSSRFSPNSILEDPRNTPIAVVTVLFRPTVHEARSVMGLVAALESAFVVILSLRRLRWARRALGSIRRQAYVGFALIFCAGYIVGLSGFGNFGTLVRQRSLIMPFYLLLFTVPPRNDDRVEVTDGDA